MGLAITVIHYQTSPLLFQPALYLLELRAGCTLQSLCWSTVVCTQKPLFLHDLSTCGRQWVFRSGWFGLISFFASIALTLLVFQQLQLFRGNWLKSCIKGGFPDVWITNLSLWLSNLIIKILDPQIFWNKHVGLTRSYQKWEKFRILNILANLTDLAVQLYIGWLPWLSI